MTGTQLETLCTELNGGASIGSTFLFQLINLAKGIVENRRPWMTLRSTDISVAVLAGNTWQTALSTAGIPRFSRFYGEHPIKLFDGNNGITAYSQRPFSSRLFSRSDPTTFVYDESAQTLYLNGSVPYAGTLWIDHLKNSPDIMDDDSSTWTFPSWSHPLLGLMAVAMNKGGVDYDDINARMVPQQQAQALQIMQALEAWDNERQLSAVSQTDPYQSGHVFRPNAIDLDA